MRKLLTLAFLLLFSLPLISPLFALATATSLLPICCRNNGIHHCEGMPGEPGDTTLVSAPSHCNSYPQATTPARTGALSLNTPSNLPLSVAPPIALCSLPSLFPRNLELTEGHPRGPPAYLL